MIQIILSLIIFILFTFATFLNLTVSGIFLIIISLVLILNIQSYLLKIRFLNPQTIYATLFIIAGLCLFLFIKSNIVGILTSFALILLCADLIFSPYLIKAKEIPHFIINRFKIIYSVLTAGIFITGISFLSGFPCPWFLICTIIIIGILIIKLITNFKRMI